MSFQNMGLNVRRLIEHTGSAEGAGEAIRDILYEDKSPEAKRVMTEFSLRECAEQLRNEGFENIPLRAGHLAEAVDTTAFSVITSELISKKVMDTYNDTPKILDLLTTPFDSNLLVDRIPGTYLTGSLDEVAEGMPYNQDADIKDKYVQIDGAKRGKILNITEEAVLFDQTGTIMLRAGGLGRLGAIDRDRRGLYTIMDISVGGTNYYCWYPANSRTAIWANAGGAGHAHEYDNLIVDVLADYTDIDAANLILGTMKDDNGDNISVPATILLVPRALEVTAKRLILNSSMPGGANSNEINPFYNSVQVVPSPIIDGCGDANATTNWWWGDFKSQFVEKRVYPMQVLRDSSLMFDQDIVARFKVREYSQVGAVDYRYVVKSTGAGA